MSNGFADSNRASLRYIAEDPNAWGVTPANGSPREMRITGSELKASKDTVQSNELRSDRMIPSIVEVGAKAEGDVNVEFSAGALDDFLAAFVYGLWSRPMGQDKFAGVGVSFLDNDTVAIAGGDFSHYFTVGRRVKTEGFRSFANNRYWQIATIVYNAAQQRTELSFTDTTAVAEAGSVFTKLVDANDVIVANSTAIRAGTAGAASIDSNGTNAFAAAVAAGQLKVGQKIFIEGATGAGSVDFTAGLPAASDTLTVGDGVKVLQLQFGGSVPNGVVDVEIGADATETGDNLAKAIMVAYLNGRIDAAAENVAGVVTVKQLTGAGGALAAGVKTGTHTVTDFTGGAALRGVYTVTAVADDSIGILPAPPTVAAGSPITVKGSMLRNPSKVQDFVRQSFSIETSFEDIGQHFLGSGLRVGSFELNVASGEIVNGKVGFMGSKAVRNATSKLRNAPYKPKKTTEYDVMNATANVGSLTLNGQALATALKDISLTGDASLREQRAVGSKYARGIGVGRFDLKGKFTAYFEDGEMFDRFIEHQTVSLGFNFRDVEGNHYEVTLPAIKLTSDPVSPGKIDEDVMEEIEWMAQRDSATECMIQFDRFSSVKAPTA